MARDGTGVRPPSAKRGRGLQSSLLTTPSCHPLHGSIAIAHLAAFRIAVDEAGTSRQDICHSFEATVRMRRKALGHDHGGEERAQEVERPERVAMVHEKNEWICVLKLDRAYPSTKGILEQVARLAQGRREAQHTERQALPCGPDWQAGMPDNLLWRPWCESDGGEREQHSEHRHQPRGPPRKLGSPHTTRAQTTGTTRRTQFFTPPHGTTRRKQIKQDRQQSGHPPKLRTRSGRNAHAASSERSVWLSALSVEPPKMTTPSAIQSHPRHDTVTDTDHGNV